MAKMCSKCGNPPRPRQRYCKGCHAAHMRANRPRHCELSTEQRRKANARSYANVYQRRGYLQPQPCELCGSAKAEKHHENYAAPLAIRWLCRECHLSEHRREKSVQVAA
jgi:hypothetical protein